jgi:glycerol-3-phosphate dehydrogenase (NAD(P)+)
MNDESYAPGQGMTMAVIGAGSWGTTLADYLAGRGYSTNLWAYESEVALEIGERRENSLFLPGFNLSEKVRPTTSLEEAVFGAGLILFVVPSHVARAVLVEMKPFLRNLVPLISATKGLETDSLMLPLEVILDTLGDEWKNYLGCLSGPSFAREVAQGLPTAVSLSMYGEETARTIQSVFSSDTLRVYTNRDVIGLQIGGAVKNVIAISAGISDGLGLGNNARAALITRGLAEMKRLGHSMGASTETFSGLSGLGDLILTCTGDLSRNRTLGKDLGRGRSLGEILKEMRMVAEGVHTSQAMVNLAARQEVEMPICQQTYQIIHQGKKPQTAIMELMSRTLKKEN